MPVVGILTGKVDARKLLAIGLTGTAGAMFMVSRFSLNVGFWKFWWPLMLHGAGLGLIFVPLTAVTNDPIPMSAWATQPACSISCEIWVRASEFQR